ncbi:MAG: zinc-binding dehydrogenase [Propionibacteriales bacterium]|nr:zinc-binding dehydrogenase [Propionibacteriales bacterium]
MTGMTQTSEAVVIRAYGEPDQLQLEQVPTPEPSAGQVLVEVEAAGVAYADVLMRRGIYPETPRVPFTPGYDLVGRVLATGADVPHLRVGDRVAALTVTGANATHAVADASLTVKVPAGLGAPEVCALVLNWVTARQMLHRIATVPSEGSILVHGAAGGVGTALLELAQAHDVRAYGSASGERTQAVVARGGIPIDRRERDVIAEVLQREPGGVDATFDAIGGTHLHRSRTATGREGTVVSYGVSFGVDAGHGRSGTLVRQAVALTRARLTRGATISLYVIAGPRGYATRHPGHFREDLEALIEQLAQGRIHPEVTVMSLREAAAAHSALEGGQVTGKLVLVP